MADFRYTFEGAEVEAFQITEASRYQDKLWPDWLDSRMFFTQNNETWIVINGDEKPMPDLGWLVHYPDGHITIRGALELETAVKTVPDVLENFDDVIAHPTEIHTQTVVPDNALLKEVTMAFEMLIEGEQSAAEKILRNSLSDRTTWCECNPGKCDQVGDKLGCRKHSPLVE